jgi:hypothetical protein
LVEVRARVEARIVEGLKLDEIDFLLSGVENIEQPNPVDVGVGGGASRG